jgi:GT2 family glycosyltransferase
MAHDLSKEELERRLATRNAELAAAHARIDHLVREVAKGRETRRKLEQVREERRQLHFSLEYRFGRAVVRPLRRLIAAFLPSAAPATESKPVRSQGATSISYHEWRSRQPEVERPEPLDPAPVISIVMPVFNTPLAMLDEAIQSVRAQTYESWELLITDDASTDPAIRSRLDEVARRDQRIKPESLTQNSGISAASNAALARATGRFVAFLDHDDFLEPNALYEIALAIKQTPEADLIYSDEDKVDETGYFQQPFFKPDWSPDAMLSSNYICHFTAIRRTLLEEVGGFRSGYDGAQDYDLFLRGTERARAIVHIPKVLYHWRISSHSTAGSSHQKPAAIENGRRAVEDALERRGIEADVTPGVAGARYRVRYAIDRNLKVSIIIPTRDRAELLSRCIETMESLTDYANYEIVVVDNESRTPAAKRYLGGLKHRVLSFDGPFNFSAICNYGARNSSGELLLFLNNDVEVIEPGWLTAMVEHGQRREIGAVGALLLFPDGSVQHAGILLGNDPVAQHAYFGEPADSFSNGGFLQMIRNYSAVTGACLLTRRAVLEECGGFDETGFAVSYNDVDLCLRMRDRGYRIVYTPHAKLVHHESASRGYERSNPAEAQLLRERWGAVLAHDPFGNSNLSVFVAATQGA